MEFVNSFKKSLFQTNALNFNAKALDLFRFQSKNNKIYSEYLNALNIDPSSILSIEQIPFLPIEFFKNHKVVCGVQEEKVIFKSSGTTGQERSTHFVYDPVFYKENSEVIFEKFYGPITDWIVLAMLPGYRENKESSLIFMIDNFIEKTQTKDSCYVFSLPELQSKLVQLKDTTRKILVWGVTFALLDLADSYSQDLSRVVLLETGGMKGRRKELTREELHDVFYTKLNVKKTHSEYGMTELLSQAYSLGDGKFKSPEWMKIMIRDLHDPFQVLESGKNGGINVIDFANIDSCAFIETKDAGILHQDGSFEVKGRIDNSDVRGCNLLYLN